MRRFLGVVNYLSKFSPNLATLSQPWRELLSKNCQWEWGTPQESPFLALKQELTAPTVLRLYDPNVETKMPLLMDLGESFKEMMLQTVRQLEARSILLQNFNRIGMPLHPDRKRGPGHHLGM